MTALTESSEANDVATRLAQWQDEINNFLDESGRELAEIARMLDGVVESHPTSAEFESKPFAESAALGQAAAKYESIPDQSPVPPAPSRELASDRIAANSPARVVGQGQDPSADAVSPAQTANPNRTAASETASVQQQGDRLSQLKAKIANRIKK